MKKVLRIGLASFLVLILFCFQAQADMQQKTKGYRPSKEQPELPPYLPEKKGKDFTLPPVHEKRDISPSGHIFVLTGVEFEGNTIFSDQELNRTAAPFLNQNISLADLEELRYRLTKQYLDKGYPNSGALIRPGQTVDDGVITYTLVEGRLNEIKIAGNQRLRPAYIRNRIWPDPDAVFNTEVLQESFQILLQDPLIKRMNGQILPGTQPGQALLDLVVTREKPYEMSITTNNHSPPSLGSQQLLLGGVLRNLTGFGDSLNLLVALTQGTDDWNVRFSIPVTRRNTLLTIGYNRTNNTVIEEPLDDLDVKSKLESARISFNHPVYKTLQRNADLGFTLETKKSETYLLDTPFSFSKGYDNGKSKISALRFVQSFQDRSVSHAFVLRSTISLGLDLFDATIHSDDLPDGEFVAWLGQFQYARRLGGKWGQIIVSGNVQISDDHLLSMEQFSLGGASSVRGYRENEMVRDNGTFLSSEWRIPVWKWSSNKWGDGQLLVAPFVDFGSGWNKSDDSNENSLCSAGIGLLWESPRIKAELYLAHGFEDAVSKAEHDLQDDGIHFSVTIKLF